MFWGVESGSLDKFHQFDNVAMRVADKIAKVWLQYHSSHYQSREVVGEAPTAMKMVLV